jgi:ankyrin repeat protein
VHHPLNFDGLLHVVELLLKQPGIDVNHADEYGYTALIWASVKGHLNIVELLLEQPGIDVNHKNNNGDTALILASQNGHVTIVTLLKGIGNKA